MDLRFLFDREGNNVTKVAKAAGVAISTASRWKTDGRHADWTAIAALYRSGLLNDADLRAAGLVPPVETEPGTAPTPSAPASTEGVAE